MTKIANTIASAVLAASIAVGTTVTAQADTQIRMLKTWDQRHPGSNAICDRFKAMVESASGGSISITTSGPETIPPLDQVEPVQNGLFQILCTYPAFHAGTTTLLAGFESVRPDATLIRESGAHAIIDEHYRSLGLALVAVPMGHGGAIFLREPLEAGSDLTGLQIRSLPIQHPIIKAIGGTPVVLPPAEMFSALERGLVDGALFTLAGMTNYGLNEVTSYYMRPYFLSLPFVILANADYWDGLSAEDRTLLEEQARLLEDEIPEIYAGLNDTEESLMQEAGLQPTDLSEAASAKLFDALRSGSWAFAATRAGDAAAALQKAVEDKGLLD